jgi:hypothetical protein
VTFASSRGLMVRTHEDSNSGHSGGFVDAHMVGCIPFPLPPGCPPTPNRRPESCVAAQPAHAGSGPSKTTEASAATSPGELTGTGTNYWLQVPLSDGGEFPTGAGHAGLVGRVSKGAVQCGRVVSRRRQIARCSQGVCFQHRLIATHLAQLKGLAQDIATLQRQYIGAGDSSSAETLVQYGLQLSKHVSTGEGSAFLSTSSWAMPWSASS